MHMMHSGPLEEMQIQAEISQMRHSRLQGARTTFRETLPFEPLCHEHIEHDLYEVLHGCRRKLFWSDNRYAEIIAS